MQTIHDIEADEMGSEARFAGRGLVRSDRAIDAFQTVAWRAPEPRRDRFTAANVAGPAEAESEEIPHWMILVGGGLLAALMGALMGGAMAL
ncbi:MULTISPECIES: hypothetical protein [Bacteria]|jgi:hypothetical protein|uniref:hypothetical protein n=1 Tax=Bacteria TaxID=2 RepID=UPI000E90B330|nr:MULTISPECIES: hypothetical protein [unclassified Brevundimonas]HAV48715.1 hypothetical protein [Brevundimonas sp.]|tara:strand:+ start:1058 stop:1330 length:273 start_codon:yes stop_codon:yes gene_type:complete